jgi:cyclopropane fatty-acyl-phospholipid synthase-like methyltransferase
MAVALSITNQLNHNYKSKMKPFAESCTENQQPILEILQKEFAEISRVLEIGSGTGQHAVFFARALPHLIWQTSDVVEHHPGINAWISDEDLDNTLVPLPLNVETDTWPEREFDGVFSANTVHIMGWVEVEKMFAGIGQVLLPGGHFCLYGPFNYVDQFTSDSIARFEVWLKNRDPKSGIRDVADLNELAEKSGLELTEDYEMPANNRILVWQANR